MKRKGFMRRLIFSYLVIAVLPLSIFAGIYSFSSIRGAEDAAKRRLESSVDLMSLQFDSIIGNMSMVSLNLVGNVEFRDAAQELCQENRSYSLPKSYNVISSAICSHAILSSDYDVTYFNDAGILATSYNGNCNFGLGFRLDSEEVNTVSWHEDVQDNFGQALIIPLQENKILRIEQKSLTLVRAVRNPSNVYGYLVVGISEERLGDLMKVDEAMDAELLITRADGTILYESAGFPIRSENGIMQEECLEQINKDYLVARRDSSDDIVVNMVMSRQSIYAESRNSIGMLGFQMFGLLCLTVLVIIIFSKDLAKPLLALRDEMKRTNLHNLQKHGNENLFERYEEVSDVYRQFNEMRERLDVMIQREMETQKMYMEEQMNYLQAQINPHFMCNTLNVIGIMGIEHGAQKIQDACMQLSSLLRYSIADKADSISTLGEEMKNIRDYLELMKLRYEHKLEGFVFCEEEMEEIPIPRLVLEPFVENVFVHAYSSYHKIVRVNVTGYIQKERWYVVIEDNGQGMTEGQLRKLKEKIDFRCRQLLTGQRSDKMQGIGIENTLMRLYLYYNSRFRYELESGENAGFRITLSANLKGDENNGTDEGSNS